jgi:hypothetical protein
MRGLLVVLGYLLAVVVLASCGGGGPVSTAQSQDLQTAPFTQGVNAFNCTGIPCLTSQGKSVSGGVAGNVNVTFAVHRIAIPGTETFEWANVSILDNHAQKGENVAIYGQANAYNTGPTWGGVFEVTQRTDINQSLVGLESRDQNSR